MDCREIWTDENGVTWHLAEFGMWAWPEGTVFEVDKPGFLLGIPIIEDTMRADT